MNKDSQIRIMGIAMTAALVHLIAVPEAVAQEVSILHCEGYFMQGEAVIEGQRAYVPYNAMGDGTVKFSGVINSVHGTARIYWEGYSQSAPFSGIVDTSAGPIYISVLDATGDDGSKMIIYEDRASLGAPTILGELRCTWRRA
jgi:hypothetical protein